MTREKADLDTAQVLHALRGEVAAGLDPQLESRLLTRIETSAVALGLDFVGSAHARSGAALQQSITATSAPVSIIDRLSALLAVRPVTSLLTTLAIGGAIGASGHQAIASYRSKSIGHAPVVNSVSVGPGIVAQLANPQTPVVSVDDLPKIPKPPAANIDRSPASRPPRIEVQAAAASTETNPLKVEPSGLAEQLELLEKARAALGRGNSSVALQLLHAHAEQYPQSALKEERDALTIKSLTRANRLPEAKAQLSLFESEFPGSLLLSTLRQSIDNIP